MIKIIWIKVVKIMRISLKLIFFYKKINIKTMTKRRAGSILITLKLLISSMLIPVPINKMPPTAPIPLIISCDKKLPKNLAISVIAA